MDCPVKPGNDGLTRAAQRNGVHASLTHRARRLEAWPPAVGQVTIRCKNPASSSTTHRALSSSPSTTGLSASHVRDAPPRRQDGGLHPRPARSATQAKKIRPRFAYLSPFLRQSKTVAWDYLRTAMAPVRANGASAHETELRVDYPNGGQVRLYGADNPDALRGIYLDGIVLDEYADMDPRVWSEIIRPALADRQGWAVFIAAIVGSYHGKLMARAEQDRRIAPVPYDPAALVWTSWDLGIRDATAIWFAQVIGREIRIIDYYEASGVDLGHYVREIGARPYVYAGHIVPHDAQAKELGTGKSRLEVLESLGLKNISIAPLHRVEDGINAVRVFLPKCWFNAKKCARGIDALKLYRAEYDDKLQALRPRPVHDWTSHAADSFRYLALTLDRKATQSGFYRRIEYSQLGVV